MRRVPSRRLRTRLCLCIGLAAFSALVTVIFVVGAAGAIGGQPHGATSRGGQVVLAIISLALVVALISGAMHYEHPLRGDVAAGFRGDVPHGYASRVGSPGAEAPQVRPGHDRFHGGPVRHGRRGDLRRGDLLPRSGRSHDLRPGARHRRDRNAGSRRQDTVSAPISPRRHFGVEANIVLRRVPDEAWPLIAGRRLAPLAAVAIVLAEDPDPRAARVGREVIAQISQRSVAR